MGGAEVVAFQAATAEMILDRVDIILDQIEHTHRTPLEAGTALATEALIDGYLNRNSRGCRNLQTPSHLSARRPGEKPPAGSPDEYIHSLFHDIKTIRFDSACFGVFR